MRLSILLSILPLVLAAPATEKRAEPAPLIIPRGEHSQLIADKYIVKFKEGSSLQSVDEAVNSLVHDADHVYKHAFRGFAGKLDKKTLDALRQHPEVDYIEQDATVTLNAFVQQNGATWGLTRISHRAKGSTTYNYDDSAGVGTCAYVIDTGVDDTHPEFQGRATQAVSFISGQATDGHGHGTHVSGTIGSLTYGVAKKTLIYGIKVLDNRGSGSNAGVIAGMDWASNDRKTRNCPKGAVANMSLGGSFSAAVNQAAANLWKSNVFLAVAAGNDNKDSKYYSPSSEPTVFSVAASTNADAKAYYSNYGALVKAWAPGSEITSTWTGGGIGTISGTSMATPHVAGLGAYLYSLEGITSPDALAARIIALGTKNILTGVPSGTVNLVVFNGNPSG